MHAVLIDDRPDTTHLSVDRLPRTTSTLPCATCGATAARHAHSACETGFTRPQLPTGYAYLDDLEPGAHIRFRDKPWYGSERILDVSGPRQSWGAQPLLTMHTEALVVNPPAVHYVAPATIVQVLDPDLPVGS